MDEVMRYLRQRVREQVQDIIKEGLKKKKERDVGAEILEIKKTIQKLIEQVRMIEQARRKEGNVDEIIEKKLIKAHKKHFGGYRPDTSEAERKIIELHRKYFPYHG